jgi:hypothetical protein
MKVGQKVLKDLLSIISSALTTIKLLAVSNSACIGMKRLRVAPCTLSSVYTLLLLTDIKGCRFGRVYGSGSEFTAHATLPYSLFSVRMRGPVFSPGMLSFPPNYASNLVLS